MGQPARALLQKQVEVLGGLGIKLTEWDRTSEVKTHQWTLKGGQVLFRRSATTQDLDGLLGSAGGETSSWAGGGCRAQPSSDLCYLGLPLG